MIQRQARHSEIEIVRGSMIAVHLTLNIESFDKLFSSLLRLRIDLQVPSGTV